MSRKPLRIILTVVFSLVSLFLLVFVVAAIVETVKAEREYFASYAFTALLFSVLLAVTGWLTYRLWRPKQKSAVSAKPRRLQEIELVRKLGKGEVLRADWGWFVWPVGWIIVGSFAIGLGIEADPMAVRSRGGITNLAIGAVGVLLTAGFVAWFPWSIKVRLWPDRMEWRTASLRKSAVRYHDIDYIESAALLGFGAARVWRFYLRNGAKSPIILGGVNGLGAKKKKLMLQAIRRTQPGVRVRRENWRGQVDEK